MTTRAILGTVPLGFQWPTVDPFLFCVHHDDAYPRGDGQMAPRASLSGRELGMDFAGKDGWRMYHGRRVPGFPQHPHRGFETVTIVRKGLVDHSDSLGAAARFGHGDVQWMTAGEGIVHSEMFPLVDDERENPLELFQIWVNLPRREKLCAPHFSMMWSEDIPRHTVVDDVGRATTVTTIAGALAGHAPPPPPPRSWAADPEHDVAIWTLTLDAGARFTLPAARAGTLRVLYVFAGESLVVDGTTVDGRTGVQLDGAAAVALEAGPARVEALLLQGRPIDEPVVQHGPFVMCTPGEIRQAFADYQRTRFGGWPWPDDDPVHPKERARFARHADGRVEERDARPRS